jgi:hypothetical protein
VGRFFFGALTFRGVLPGDKPHRSEPIFQLFRVLLYSIFDHLRPMPRKADVPIDPANHFLAAVTHFPAHGVNADRRPVVKRLKSSRAVGMPIDASVELPSLPYRANSDPVEQLPHVHQPGLLSVNE